MKIYHSIEDFPQENREHTRLVRDNDTLFLEFITNEQIRLNPQVEFLTDNGNFNASKIENLVYGTTWDSNTSWIAELKIGDHIETLDDREGFFGFKITDLLASSNAVTKSPREIFDLISPSNAANLVSFIGNNLLKILSAFS